MLFCAIARSLNVHVPYMYSPSRLEASIGARPLCNVIARPHNRLILLTVLVRVVIHTTSTVCIESTWYAPFTVVLALVVAAIARQMCTICRDGL